MSTGTHPPAKGPDIVRKVIEAERKDIVLRRQRAFPDQQWQEAEVAKDLVGLALSGGGIRSAMFNLGVLQALHASGLLRYVDYLSTVSGGSYIGAHLSSQMLKLREESREPNANAFAILKDHFPLKETQRQPQPERILRFIREGRYLSRFWKFAAHYLSGLLLNLAVFSSFMVCVCALAALFWRLFDMPGVRTVLAFGQTEGFFVELTPDLLRAFFPSLLCAILYLFVKWLNVRSDRQARAEHADELQKWHQRHNLNERRPERRGSSTWFKDTLEAAGWLSALLGLAVLLGDGNVSVGLLRHLLPEHWLTYDASLKDNGSLSMHSLPDYLRLPLYGLLLAVAAAIVLTSLLPLVMPSKVLTSGQRPAQARDLTGFRLIAGASLLGVPLLVFFLLARENVSRVAPLGKIRKVHIHDKDRLPALNEIRLIPPFGRDTADLVSFTSFVLELRFDGEVADLWPERDYEVRIVPNWERGVWQGKGEPFIEVQFDLDLKRPSVVRLWPAEPQLLPEAGFWIDVYDRKRNHRDLGVVAVNGPDVRRMVTVGGSPLIEHDQLTRMKWFAVSGGIFLFFGVFVSLNWTSLHKFYRDRLREAYIEPVPGMDRHIPVSKLDNVSLGAPYHLIGAALNLIGKRDSREPTDTFVFSKHYCGSDATGFWPTDQMLRGFDDLAEVTAISGGAVSPVQAHDLIVATLMTLVNVRLGQWLPNPRHSRFFPWPNAVALALGFLRSAEDRRRWFVSDGGHDENLGLWPLIQRRCKLILISDATQDAEHAFEDFLRLCRRIRLREGIQFLDLDDQTRSIDLKRVELKSDYTSRYHYFIGRVRYPKNFPWDAGRVEDYEDGYLIYLKPSLTLDEEHDLISHFRRRRPFPHDPTVDQLYDPNTVESYRQLGSHIGGILCRLLVKDQMWERAHRYSVEEKLFEPLAGSLREVPPDPEEEEGLLFAEEWEQDKARAEFVVRRYEADPQRRNQWDQEVADPLAPPLAQGPRPAQPGAGVSFPLAGAIAGWALACNGRATGRGAAGHVLFQPRGRARLVKLAARHGPLLELHSRERQWKQFVDYLRSLALGVREGVFHGGGRETALELILCLLDRARFQQRPGQLNRDALLKAIGNGDGQLVVALLHAAYDKPAPAAAQAP